MKEDKKTPRDPLAPLIAFLFRIGKEERKPAPWQQHRALELLKKMLYSNSPNKP